VKKLLGLTLGIMTALGGFVDIGQFVFTAQAGALFGYRLLWVVVLGTWGIILYSEMCGRIAAVKKRAVFDVVREELPRPLALVTLWSSLAVNVITCAAQLGALALLLRLWTGWNDRIGILIAAALLFLVTWVLRFRWLERLFGLWGVVMVVFVFALLHEGADWDGLARGLLPTFPLSGAHEMLLYGYFAMGIFSAILMPYEVYFYSSGAMEENWQVEQLGENRLVAIFGCSLGALVTVALLALAAMHFLPHGVFPGQVTTAMLLGTFAYGHVGLLLAALGLVACLGGAAVETALSCGYNFCQMYQHKWGRKYPPLQTRVFTRVWVGTIVVSALLVQTGVDPLKLVDYSIVFAMVILPLTYLPVLLLGENKKVMGEHVNSRIVSAMGWAFLVLITLAAAAAIPLMILTKNGTP
jgi:Mn2+/Fe2+ NRAMP family transporter